jgi:hypothetical protein
LHWKEQGAQYEKVELESFPPKKKFRMLQNLFGNVNELASVKQIGDQEIARGIPPLDVDSYLELLLSTWSTYDKNQATAMSNVYTTVVGEDNDIQIDDTGGNEQYTEVFTLDTDISEVLAYVLSNIRP